MRTTLTVVVIDDQDEYLQELKQVLESGLSGCRVKTLNPNRDENLTFDSFFTEIEAAAENALVVTVVLLDQHLGSWRWNGANLAPSLCNVISISTEIVPWAKTCFQRKQQVVEGDQFAVEELLAAIRRTAAPFFTEVP